MAKYKERMKLPWPTFAGGNQDRGAFKNLVPSKAIKYWTNILIKDGKGIHTVTKEGRAAGSHNQPGKNMAYISSETCGALTLCCGIAEYGPGEGSAVEGVQWHTVEEALYVLSGRGCFEVEGKRYDVKPGDWVFVPMRAKHNHMNTGKVPFRYLFVKGIRLRSYDGPTETPIDYREFERIE